MHSILRHAVKIETDPFPYVVIENALDDYAELAATRWDKDRIANGRNYVDNQRLDLSAHKFLGMSPPPVWAEFVSYHVSQAFWRDVWDVFGVAIKSTHPGLAVGRNTSTCMRFAGAAKIGLECQIGMNTPTKTAGSVRGPHIDSLNEIMGGMLYMPLPEDNAGGDLEIHRLTGKPKFAGKMQLLPGLSEYVATVPYRANTFVMFVNGPRSVHAVTRRQPTHLERRLVSFGIDFEAAFFDPMGA